MMLAKPKPDDSSEEEMLSPPPMEATEDREKELERRLALLGEGEEEPKKEEEEEAVIDETPAAAEEEKPLPMQSTFTKKEDPFEALNEPNEVKPEAAAIPALVDTKTTKPIETKVAVPPPTVVVEEKKPATIGTPSNSKSALLARIKLVQERAKQAQMKQTSAVVEESAPTSRLSEKEKMMKALNGETEQKMDTQQPVQSNNNNMVPPPPFEALTTTAPPPPFEILEQQKPVQSQVPLPPPPPPPFEALTAPPPFEILEQEIKAVPSAPPVEASAPPAYVPDLMSEDHLAGVTPVMAPPPTFESMEQSQQQQQQHEGEIDTDAYDFDIDGNHLTHEEKVKMMEEQRAIMEQIKKESNQNAASEATARATAFELRSNTAAAEAAAASDVIASPTTSVATAASIDGEDRKITMQSVDIGGGQKVALHGQEKTKAAIRDGTAILVKCLNCGSWMQVTETATLMFCPNCSAVSPVIKQDMVHTLDEVRQLEADRKLAEQLQREEDERNGTATTQSSEVSDYPGARRSAQAQQQNAPADTGSSWLDSLMPASLWASEEKTGNGSAEIAISRPPGSSQRRLHQANTGTNEDNNDLHLEQESLLESNSQSRPAGRVAESKPLFSCVVDSISDTANAVGGAITSYAKPADGENVHGIDTTSFLSVTNAERNPGGSGGDYRVVPDRD